MKISFHSAFVLLLTAATGLLGCKEDADPAAGLVGTWRLTDRQCYCVRTPVPDESVSFTATAFVFSSNGRPFARGTYADTVVSSLCGGTGPGLRFTYSANNQGSGSAHYTVSGNTLVLDYGSPCDAPRETYKRLN